MSSWNSRSFIGFEHVLDYLNGSVFGSANLADGADVDGLTLIINNGTSDVTVTFAPAKGRNWTAAEIADQINNTAGLAGVASIANKTRAMGQSLDLRLRIMGDPNHTVKSTGTANSVLGFSTTSDTAQSIIPDSEVKYILDPTRSPNQKWIVVTYS